MAYTHTWNITKMDSWVDTGIVFNVHFSVTTKDTDNMDFTMIQNMAVSVPYNPADATIPYAELTEETVIGWVQNELKIYQLNEDGSFAVDPFFGDIHFHSRSGRGGIANGPVIAIDHWDGDGRNPLTPETPQTLVQFKTDDFEKSCRLLARSRVVLPSDIDYHIWPSEEDLPFEVIDSTPYNAPFVGTKIINLPFEFGGGVTGVEIRIHCGSFDCGGVLSIQGNGAASYVNANMMSNADKCTSYGKFKGNL